MTSRSYYLGLISNHKSIIFEVIELSVVATYLHMHVTQEEGRLSLEHNRDK